MTGWLFDRNPGEGSVETFHEDGDGWVVKKTQDVEPVVEENKGHKNLVGDYRPLAGKEMVRFASVPKTVIEDEIAKRGLAWWHDTEAVKKWIMDRDQAVFRTHPGKF